MDSSYLSVDQPALAREVVLTMMTGSDARKLRNRKYLM